MAPPELTNGEMEEMEVVNKKGKKPLGLDNEEDTLHVSHIVWISAPDGRLGPGTHRIMFNVF